jgi:hypothetical protein
MEQKKVSTLCQKPFVCLLSLFFARPRGRNAAFLDNAPPGGSERGIDVFGSQLRLWCGTLQELDSQSGGTGNLLEVVVESDQLHTSHYSRHAFARSAALRRSTARASS